MSGIVYRYYYPYNSFNNLKYLTNEVYEWSSYSLRYNVIWFTTLYKTEPIYISPTFAQTRIV